MYLIGFVNIFNVIPDFVIPVFSEKHNLDLKSLEPYYVQYIIDDEVIMEQFSLKPSYLFYGINDKEYHFVYLDEEDRTINQEFLINNLEPYLAFQMQNEIYFGRIFCFLNYINNVKVDNQYLIEQIEDMNQYLNEYEKKIFKDKFTKELVKSSFELIEKKMECM